MNELYFRNVSKIIRLLSSITRKSDISLMAIYSLLFSTIFLYQIKVNVRLPVLFFMQSKEKRILWGKWVNYVEHILFAEK